MKLKQAILSVMGRDALKTVVDELELDGVDRRSVEDMRGRLSRAHRATPEALLEHLGESEVKAVCDLVGIPANGRRAALVDALLPSTPTDPNTPRRGRAQPEVDDEPTRWMRPEEAQMSEQPTDKPDVQRPREPGRPFEITRTELVWPGKYDEHGNLVEPPRVSLPFQVIEVIEEGRTSREALKGTNLSLFAARPMGPAEDGWRNKLIWGDNLLVEASLLKDFAGKIDLIFIDPPFATGLDFSVRTVIGDDQQDIKKEQSLLEEKAYRDTWGRGYDSYLQMLYPRLLIARDILSNRGSIYVHVGPQVNHFVRLLLDDIFGTQMHRREIVWKRVSSRSHGHYYPATHDSILFYSKSDDLIWNQLYEPLDPEYVATKYRFQDPDGRRYRKDNCLNQNKDRPNLTYKWNGHVRTWRWTKEKMQELHDTGRLIYTSNGIPEYKRYLEESLGTALQSVWTDINPINSQATEDTGYDTQKPETLLERIVNASSNRGDLVADVFCGSGTTLAVAEKLGRRWVGCDLGRFAIHTTRKRLLDLRVKDAETGEERGCRPFEVLNLGRYERKYWQGITFGNEPKSDEETALAAYVKFILDLYKARPVQGSHVHGKKGGAFVRVGAVDAPVTISQIEDASAEAQRLGGRELHILGWELEMGLHDPITQYVRAQHGVIVRLVSIPRETMERRAVEAGDVQFFDLAYLEVEVKPEKGGKKERAIKVVLKDFVIPSTDLIPEEVRGKIKKWSDYIDYWAVDWDFRNDTFVNQWQTYRTRQDRSLALETPAHAYDKAGTHQILVKVVDIFGNDTSHLVKWEAR
ncbi:MAG: site-specific DNA-methyltransferase [Deltaproteobacteria bacterium]|nr:site-specific DNA-methyltransferase [Deltaproteobacteria bacterium]